MGSYSDGELVRYDRNGIINADGIRLGASGIVGGQSLGSTMLVGAPVVFAVDMAAYTMYGVDTSLGPWTLTLPSSGSKLVPSCPLWIKKIGADGNAITLSCPVSTIEGAATYVFSNPWQAVRLIWLGQWLLM